MASIELFSGLDPQVLEYTQHATPSGFKAGDLVTITDGKIAIATTAITFLGISRDDADTDVTNKKIDVELIDPHAIYSVRMDTLSESDPPVSSLVGDAVEFVMTAGAMVIATSLTSNASAYVVGIDPRDPVGDSVSGGRVLIRFLGTALVNQN